MRRSYSVKRDRGKDGSTRSDQGGHIGGNPVAGKSRHRKSGEGNKWVGGSRAGPETPDRAGSGRSRDRAGLAGRQPGPRAAAAGAPTGPQGWQQPGSPPARRAGSSRGSRPARRVGRSRAADRPAGLAAAGQPTGPQGWQQPGQPTGPQGWQQPGHRGPQGWPAGRPRVRRAGTARTTAVAAAWTGREESHADDHHRHRRGGGAAGRRRGLVLRDSRHQSRVPVEEPAGSGHRAVHLTEQLGPDRTRRAARPGRSLTVHRPQRRHRRRTEAAGVLGKPRPPTH